jgi:exonuclease III
MIVNMLTMLIKSIKTDKFLRIAQWNANGLQNHKEEIKLFLKQNFIDILLISETHFTTKNYFSIPRYKL